jgi:AsmA-like C-terminal region
MRRILVSALAVLVLVVLALVGALELLESSAGKERIASALSGALGQPVEIGALSISILPTPALTASRVQIGAGGSDSAPGITAAGLRIVPSLSSLLPGRTLTIDRADLVDVVVSIRRTASGQWLAPVPGAQRSTPTSGSAVGRVGESHPPPARSGSAPAPQLLLVANPASESTAPETGAPALPVKREPQVAVDAFHLRDGTIRVVDQRLRGPSGGPTITDITGINAQLRYVAGTLSIVDFEARLGHTTVQAAAEAGPQGITLHVSSNALNGEDLPAILALAGVAAAPGVSISGQTQIDMNTRVASDYTTLTVDGRASIGQLQLGRLTLQTVSAPFRLDHNVLTSDPITFAAYGGRERGQVSVNLGGAPATYGVRATLDQLDVNQALSGTTSTKNVVSGTAHLAIDVTGRGMQQAAIERSLAGTVRFAVEHGVIRNLPVLATIDRLEGGKSGNQSDMKFDSLSGTATIANGQARTTDLALRAGDVSLVGNGTFGFVDQALDFVLTAQVSPTKSAQVVRVMPLAKRLENGSGQLQLPVKVTGTLRAPVVAGVDVRSISKQKVQGLLHQFLKR